MADDTPPPPALARVTRQADQEAARELIRRDAEFQEWAQGYLDSGRWAGHDRSDAIKTELLERDDELKVTDELLADRQRILDACPCPVHGPCVPHVLDELKRLAAVEAQCAALHTENEKLKADHEAARLRAYRQARVMEPSMDGYYGAMSTYTAAFGKPEGEIEAILPSGERKQPWELQAPQEPDVSLNGHQAEREARQALQTALRKFGKHKQGCEAYVWAGLASAKVELCTCGFSAALHASEGAPK